MLPSPSAPPAPARVNRGPLVVKGADRLDALPLQGPPVRQTLNMYSPAICRLMRRDFNLTSLKLFWMDDLTRTRLRSQLNDLVKEATMLHDMVALDAFGPAFPVAACQMRIVNDQAQILFDALATADMAHAKMLQGPLSEVSDVYMGRFFRAYGAFRVQVFGFGSKG